jgi:hypothetical protein
MSAMRAPSLAQWARLYEPWLARLVFGRLRPNRARVEAAIDAPLNSPARVRDHKTGGCYSLYVRHGDRELLVHVSDNVLPGALDGCRADTVCLGIGTLGEQDEEFRVRNLDTLVPRTGACRVVPVHWDNFTVPLDKPLRPLPAVADDFGSAMEWITRRAAAAGVTVALPVLGRDTGPVGAGG